jgi:hypothetical protein
MPEGTPTTPKKFLTDQGEATLRRRLEVILPLTKIFDCLFGIPAKIRHWFSQNTQASLLLQS